MIINVMAAYNQLGRRVMDELLNQGASPGKLIASVRGPEKARKLERTGFRKVFIPPPKISKESVIL